MICSDAPAPMNGTLNVTSSNLSKSFDPFHASEPAVPKTLFDKLWNEHIVRDLGNGWALLHIDRHLLHDLTGAPVFAELAARDRKSTRLNSSHITISYA